MRKIFGNIISEDNLEPKHNTEYIYQLDMVWVKNQLASIPVKKGVIVENVQQLDAGDYSFNIKGEIGNYICSYGWAFIENTEKNIILLNKIDEESKLLKQQEQKVESLTNSLDRLHKNKI